MHATSSISICDIRVHHHLKESRLTPVKIEIFIVAIII